jgi:hypothetical protein
LARKVRFHEANLALFGNVSGFHFFILLRPVAYD